ncbi:Uncharacterized protein dnm_088620 [Desulfonema magnum]|uniref:Uncharacterized protein n=1 Tax=Desulfonema magnum TaxID=45655 RepID=A0A975GTA2_9BACT|nr:Uncharacterized protein dnm_088620 [Desulfonema magnum]
MALLFFTVKIHFEKPGFLSENIFMTGGEKPGFFMSVYFKKSKFNNIRSVIFIFRQFPDFSGCALINYFF